MSTVEKDQAEISARTSKIREMASRLGVVEAIGDTLSATAVLEYRRDLHAKQASSLQSDYETIERKRKIRDQEVEAEYQAALAELQEQRKAGLATSEGQFNQDVADLEEKIEQCNRQQTDLEELAYLLRSRGHMQRLIDEFTAETVQAEVPAVADSVLDEEPIPRQDVGQKSSLDVTGS